MQSQVFPDCALFIHGMPGADKTSLAARIIDHISAQPGLNHTSLLYFYFKHTGNDKRSMAHMLRALLAQLVRQDASLAHVLYEKYCSVSTREAQTMATLKSWAVELLKTQARCTIILDGPDECNHHSDGYESKRIMEWFLKSTIPDCAREGLKIRVLCLGQRDGVVDHSHKGSLSILERSEISLRRWYYYQKVSSYKFCVRLSLATPPINQLLVMFLYAKLVMDNLMAQGSIEELDEELNVNFPKGLDEACVTPEPYDRIAFRILDQTSRPQSQREAACQILKWLTCAVRPLRWREIQSLSCIDPHNGICNPRKRRVDNCKCICGSFVEIEQLESGMECLDGTDPVVGLVHDTARRVRRCMKMIYLHKADVPNRYLIQSGLVVLPEVNANMAIFSSTYLASLPFKANSAAVVRENAMNGYYGFLDFLVFSWQKHLEFCLEHGHKLSLSIIRHIQQAFNTLLQHLDDNEVIEDVDDVLESMKSFFNTNNGLRRYIKHLDHLSSAIRTVVEGIDPTDLDGRSRNVFFSLNGEQRYKCPKPRCVRFCHGFESRKSGDYHAAQHYAQFNCSIESCPRRKVGFTTRADLDQHTKEAHTSVKNKPKDLFPTASGQMEPLYDACTRGDIQAVKYWIKKGKRLIDLHLAVAAENGHVELYATLYPLAAAPRLESLHLAIRQRSITMCRVLLNAATQEQTHYYINSGNYFSRIQEAANYADRNIFDLLLSMNSRRQRPLNLAETFLKILHSRDHRAIKDTMEIMERLFSLSKQENMLAELSTDTLDRAIAKDDGLILVFLLQVMDEHITRLKSAERDSPLYKSIQLGKSDCVKS
ncbi:hypothetical protein PG994_004413, partial [Apiospora phragmitis]